MSDFVKKEKEYVILAGLFDSKYEHSILANKPFRVGKNREGAKVPYRLEVHKSALNKTLQQLIDEDQARYEAAKGTVEKAPATAGRW